MSLHSELVEIQSQPSTGQLAKALAAFQKQHHAAKRTGVVAAQVNPEKPRYNRPERKFSNLEDILEAIKPAAEHGLSHTETWHVIGTEHAVLRVTLRHTSGEQITSEWPMDMNAALNTSKEQARGSSQTYARRYLLMGIYGIVGADKDEILEELSYKYPQAPWIEDKPINADVGAKFGFETYLMEHGHNMHYKGPALKVINWEQLYQFMVRKFD